MEFVDAFVVSLQSVWNDSGFSSFTPGNGIMILVGLLLLYMAFVKEFEPLLLGPIAFGCILANFPNTGFFGEEIFPAVNFLGYRSNDGLRTIARASLDITFGSSGTNRRIRGIGRRNDSRL